MKNKLRESGGRNRMGFFSAVKRFFGQKPQEPAQASEAENQPPASIREVPPSLGNAQVQEPPAPESAKREGPAERVEPGPEAAIPEKIIAPAASADSEAQTVPDSVAAAEESAQEEAATGEVTAEELPPDTKQTESAESGGAENEALLLRLRQSEPKLSKWLEIVLEGQDVAGPELWKRLRFFLGALEAPEPEIEKFVSGFERWLERMEYSHVDEFRSELQYRLALALDLEDEEDERNRLMLKLSRGLAATREQLGRKLDSLFSSHGELNAAFWEEMEEMFIMADMGYEASLEIVERLKRRASRQKVTEAAGVRQLLMDELEEIFRVPGRIKGANKPEVILMMGVNGAGKTTTIAKLAHRARMEGKKTLVAAADTFRAAAIEQLQVWAERADSDFYARPAGSDPASVAWEAMDYAQKNDIDIVFVDTAGRLQTRTNLMEELGKIRQVLAKKQPGAPHRSMLVLDATTGQNALSQARLFREAAGADEIALTKLDGTSKGGVAIAVALQEGLPITFAGLGEKMEDLRPFNGRDFAKALLGNDMPGSDQAEIRAGM